MVMKVVLYTTEHIEIGLFFFRLSFMHWNRPGSDIVDLPAVASEPASEHWEHLFG